MEAYHAIINHYESVWQNKAEILAFVHGPMLDKYEDFRVLEFAPSAKRKCWTYATAGMSDTVGSMLELHIFSPEQDRSIVELLTATAYYHLSTEDKLGLWHTVDFGRPWKGNSDCHFGFISLPYLDGPALENFENRGGGEVVKFYWLIPITQQERTYKIKYGVDALEEKFEKASFNYLDPFRQSVV